MCSQGASRCLEGVLKKFYPGALRLLDEERGVDPGPNEWDYVDLRSQYPRHDHGEELTVVAYGEDDKHPMLFYVTLTKDGLVRWDLHPQLLAHVMGSSRGDYQAVFCSWNAISHSWDFVEPSEPFKPCDRHDLAVIRHKANSSLEGLPHFLAELDAQTHRPVLVSIAMNLPDSATPDNSVAAPPGRSAIHRPPPGWQRATHHEGRTKNLWPTLVSTHARIPPRVTSLLASISSVLTSAHPTTACTFASTTTARTYASISSLQPLKSTGLLTSASTTTSVQTSASTMTTRTSASTSAVQPSRTTRLLGSPRNRNVISTSALRRSTRICNIQKDPPNADEGTSPPTNKGKKK
ncbi:hypothetical protein LXA43DRAFT_1058516 [Ganoderma leucocontextum]|nr:hypothetical protein LXA43DRAFT_1058516 [Ganoderma leucocontextum]